MTDRKTLLRRAREMRNNPTEPEKRLLRHLLGSQLEGHKFRRQAVVDNYIADFLCPHKKLIVEVDGETHSDDTDFKRDSHLNEKGYRVMRFSNADIMGNIGGVLIKLLEKLTESPDRWRKTTPNPSFEKEGLH